MADIQVRCPRCGKRVAWRGLHGHLRFEHLVSAETASEELAEIRETVWQVETRDAVLARIREWNAHNQSLEDLEAVVAAHPDLLPEPLRSELRDALAREATARVDEIHNAVFWWVDKINTHRMLAGEEPLAIPGYYELDDGDCDESAS